MERHTVHALAEKDLRTAVRKMARALEVLAPGPMSGRDLLRDIGYAMQEHVATLDQHEPACSQLSEAVARWVQLTDGPEPGMESPYDTVHLGRGGSRVTVHADPAGPVVRSGPTTVFLRWEHLKLLVDAAPAMQEQHADTIAGLEEIHGAPLRG